MINGRNTAGQFTEGNSGKPKGSRNKATIAIERVISNKVYHLSKYHEIQTYLKL
jgi:hypothetical protein